MTLKQIIFSQVALIAICATSPMMAALITYDLGLLDNTTDGSPFNTTVTYPDAYAGGLLVMDPSDGVGRMDRMSTVAFGSTTSNQDRRKIQAQVGHLYTKEYSKGFAGSDVLSTSDHEDSHSLFKNSGTYYYNPVDTIFWIGRTKDDEFDNQTSFNDLAYGFKVIDDGNGIADAGDILELVGIIYSTGADSVFGHTADELTALVNHPWNPPFTLPALSTTYPLYAQLYSDVLVGNSVADGLSFKEGAETLSAVYAYLHPQSPVRYDPDVFARLKLLLNARFAAWSTSSALADIAGAFQCAYAYMQLKHHRPSDLTAAEISEWEAMLVKFCDYNLSTNTQLYDDHLLASQWLNGDIRLAKGVYFAGVALSNLTYQSKAKQAIDQVLTQTVSSDGATHYVGFNNEVPAYHSVSLNNMLWWWVITGSPEMKAALDQTIPYVPLSVEPSGFQEQSTAVAYKHMYNGLRGRAAALAKAYIYGDRYNYYFGQQVETSFDSDYAVLLAILHRGSMIPLTPPSDFILYDRAIMGPRGRWADWAFVATGRNVQSPEPEHPDQGFDGAMMGKNTFVGALALGSWANNTSLKAALDGVAPEFKNKAGDSSDWARSSNGVYRFLSQDENTSTITRDTFATLATDYRLSERFSSPATPDWGAGTDWLGEQLWLLTEDRIVGLVQIHNEADADVYGLDTRIVLSGGRAPILGAYHELDQVAANEYDFGELSLRINANNYGGGFSIERIGMLEGAGDDFGAILRLHDVADTLDDSLIHYPAGTRRWALIECIREGRSFANSVANVVPSNNNFAVLEVQEPSRRFRSIQNLTDSPRTYVGNFWGISGGDATLHKGWSQTVDAITVTAGNPITISVVLPPHGHAIVVSSSDVEDHSDNEKHFEDVFLETADPAMSHYLDWIYSYPGGGGGIDLGGDPDDDGVVNVAEYAFGGDPFDFQNWTMQIPEFSLAGTNVNFSYPRRNGANLYGLNYLVEMTEDLSIEEWETIPESSTSADIISSKFDFVTQQFAASGKTKAFFRVKIESDF